MKLELFLNDVFKVLNCLYENETSVAGESLVRLSQAEMAKELGMSKTKVNSILQVLCENKFIELKANGRYFISDDAKGVVEGIIRLRDA